jgi:hypothetical protein
MGALQYADQLYEHLLLLHAYAKEDTSGEIFLPYTSRASLTWLQ